jgi:PAS domain S-box-containing protein
MSRPSTISIADEARADASAAALGPLDGPTQAFLLQVVNAIQSPVFVKDERFRFVFFNEAFCALLGRSRAELIGRTDFDVVPPEQAAIFRDIDLKVLTGGRPHENEESLSSPEGSQHWILTRKSILEAPGGRRYIVGVISDITERKRMEDDLLAAKYQAEDASRAKSQFLANMSHELRTPLNAVIGFSQVIRDQLFGAIGEARYREYADDIHRSGVHLLDLINDILDLTKIEAGKHELHEEACDVAHAITDGMRLVRDLANHNGLTLRHSEQEGLPLLRADERALRQIIVNFLSNAVKFTPRGGCIDIGTRLDDDGAIAISIADTGIGMAPDDIPVALSPFRQLENSWRRKYEGTGLGLPLVKALVELHGGGLDIASTPGKGTVVTARFPPHRTIAR